MIRWNLPAAAPEHGRLTKLLLTIVLAAILVLAAFGAPRTWRDHQQLAQLRANLRSLEAVESHASPLAPELATMTATQFADALAMSIGGTWETVSDSGSMEPILHAGDLVLLDPKDISSVSVGDIIVFRATAAKQAPGSITRVVHRVIAKELCASARGAASLAGTAECTILRTQGDANPKPDPVAVRVGDFEGVLVARLDQTSGAITRLEQGRFVSR
jgi:signal peptidase I